LTPKPMVTNVYVNATFNILKIDIGNIRPAELFEFNVLKRKLCRLLKLVLGEVRDYA